MAEYIAKRKKDVLFLDGLHCFLLHSLTASILVVLCPKAIFMQNHDRNMIHLPLLEERMNYSVTQRVNG